MWLFRVLGLILLLTGLSACGFRALYGEQPGAATRDELSAIRIDPIPDRVGQEVRNHLFNRLTPDGEPARPRYRLHVTLERSSTPLAIQLDDTITRFNLILTAAFSLTDLGTGAVLYHDSVRVLGSYNVVRSEFATLISEQDAASRAAREVSEEVRTLLSVYFARRRPGAG